MPHPSAPPIPRPPSGGDSLFVRQLRDWARKISHFVRNQTAIRGDGRTIKVRESADGSKTISALLAEEFWAEIDTTDNASAAVDFTEIRDSLTGTHTAPRTGSATEVNGVFGVPPGTRIRVYRGLASSAYFFDVAFGDASNGSPKDITNTSNDEDAKTTEWDRSDQGGDRGVQRTNVARMACDLNGDAILYAFYRTDVVEANGHLETISAETRAAVLDIAELCAFCDSTASSASGGGGT